MVPSMRGELDQQSSEGGNEMRRRGDRRKAARGRTAKAATAKVARGRTAKAATTKVARGRTAKAATTKVARGRTAKAATTKVTRGRTVKATTAMVALRPTTFEAGDVVFYGNAIWRVAYVGEIR